jgi:hypothetical protein
VQVRDGRTYDTRATVKVVGEEVVETPAGRLPAMRLEREAHWQERGRDNTGTASMVYWYSAAVKRIVASESKNMTSKGKLVAHDRLELEAWNVR